MKRIILLLFSLIMISCDTEDTDPRWPKVPNTFYIDSISSVNPESNIVKYRVHMPDNSSTGSVTFYFADIKGKYQVGDILVFEKKEEDVSELSLLKKEIQFLKRENKKIKELVTGGQVK